MMVRVAKANSAIDRAFVRVRFTGGGALVHLLACPWAGWQKARSCRGGIVQAQQPVQNLVLQLATPRFSHFLSLVSII
jgi:hypothetical protein